MKYIKLYSTNYSSVPITREGINSRVGGNFPQNLINREISINGEVGNFPQVPNKVYRKKMNKLHVLKSSPINYNNKLQLILENIFNRIIIMLFSLVGSSLLIIMNINIRQKQPFADVPQNKCF